MIFFHNYYTIDSATMSTAYPQHIHTVMFTITLPCTLALLFIYAFLFTIWYFPHITVQLSIWQCLQHIRSIYIQYYLQLQYPVDWLCCLYMLPLHNVIFFHNYYTIDSTTLFPAYPQHIPTVLFTITLPSILTLLLHMLSFSQYDIFPQLLHNWLCNNVSSISSTYTYGIVYNYTTQYTDFAVYICFPFHNVIFSTHYCTIVYVTMSTAYPQHIHPVLFRTILHSILALLFIYAFLSTMWYFPQLLHNSLYNSVYSISSTYTYSTVYNYSTQ